MNWKSKIELVREREKENKIAKDVSPVVGLGNSISVAI
jgi:hypothetical protein